MVAIVWQEYRVFTGVSLTRKMTTRVGLSVPEPCPTVYKTVKSVALSCADLRLATWLGHGLRCCQEIELQARAHEHVSQVVVREIGHDRIADVATAAWEVVADFETDLKHG